MFVGNYHEMKKVSATPANSQASQEAKKNGKPYHIVMSTTPGDLNTPQGVWAKDFFDHAAKFHEKLYDWPIDQVKEYVEANSRNGFIYIEFSYKQLGRSEEWFRKQAKALDGDLFKIKREILLQWNKSSDLSPFSEAEIIRLNDHVKDPVTVLMINNIYPLKIYNSEFNWRGNLMIGVDTSPGMSKDATAVVVWDPTIGEIVATFHNNMMDAPTLQEFLVELVGTYLTNAVVIIERNNGGYFNCMATFNSNIEF